MKLIERLGELTFDRTSIILLVCANARFVTGFEGIDFSAQRILKSVMSRWLLLSSIGAVACFDLFINGVASGMHFKPPPFLFPALTYKQISSTP